MDVLNVTLIPPGFSWQNLAVASLVMLLVEFVVNTALAE